MHFSHVWKLQDIPSYTSNYLRAQVLYLPLVVTIRSPEYPVLRTEYLTPYLTPYIRVLNKYPVVDTPYEYSVVTSTEYILCTRMEYSVRATVRSN